MVRRVGAGFAEIVAETDGFENDVLAALSRAVKEAAKSERWKPMVDAAGQAGQDASREFSRRFVLDARGRLHDERGRYVSLFGRSFGSIGLEVGKTFLDTFLAGFAAAARNAPLSGGFLSFGSQLVSAFAALGPTGILGGLAAFLPIVGILVIVLPLLTSAVFALGGALVSLVGVLGVLPGLVAGLLVTIIPLVIAFQGMGDAVSALVSGDLDKFNESLKKLAPSARSVLRELQAVMPFFSGLRKDTQEAFFAPLLGVLSKFVTAAGPALSGGIQNIAFALGTLFALIGEFASSPATVDFLARLFASVTEGISTGGPVLIRFLEAIVAIADASLPVIQALFGRMGDGLDRFSQFLKDSAADGRFAAALESGIATVESLLDLVGELFGLLKDMFGTTDEAGRTFLDDIGLAIKQLREFFQSPDGKEFIENMIVLAEDFGEILIFVAGVLATIIGLFAKMIELFDDIGDGFDRVADAIRKFPSLGSGPGGILGALLLPRFARGGITEGPSLAGEEGPEAVLPLDDPVRARQVASDPRVSEMLGGGEMTFIGVFDGEPFQARIVRTIRGNNAGIARSLAQKPRR